jgi:hypothetical protein
VTALVSLQCFVTYGWLCHEWHRDNEGIIRMTSISASRFAVLALLTAVVLGTGCTVGNGRIPGGGIGTTPGQQTTGGITSSPTPTPSPTIGQPTTPPYGATGDQDRGTVPSGGTRTGAGGTAQGADLMVFLLGGLIAAGGAVVLVLRRRALG